MSSYSTDKTSNKKPISSSNLKGSETLPPNEVLSYWADLGTFQNEPGQTHFKDFLPSGHTMGNDTTQELLKKLILAEPSHGDLAPSLAAKQCCQLYEGLDMPGRRQFIKVLITEFGTSTPHVKEAAQDYLKVFNQNSPHSKDTQRALTRLEAVLRHTLVPLQHRFFDRVHQLPNGMRFLVDLRLDAFSLYREQPDPEIAALLDSLTAKLQSWLLAFLDLERITWKSSGVTLEKCMLYERVHPFRGWEDLKQRVGPGRRCYGFFHRSMALDPLVYVQVALVPTIADNVQAIVNQHSPGLSDPKLIKAAIFYSINTQAGLKGVDLGSFLIKRVVSELQTEFPQIETFCTLSPIPKFRSWLLRQLQPSTTPHPSYPTELLLPEEKQKLARLTDPTTDKFSNPNDSYGFLHRQLSTDAWMKDPHYTKVFRPILLRLVVNYLLTAKSQSSSITTYDPVANFHLRNGACVHRLNWMANNSEKGLKESFGLMVNYNYLLEHIERNNLGYLRQGKIAVSASPESPLFAPYTLPSLAPHFIFHDTFEPYPTS